MKNTCYYRTKAVIVILIVGMLISVLPSCANQNNYETVSDSGPEFDYSIDILKDNTITEKGYDIVVNYDNRVFKVQFDRDIISEEEIYDVILDFYYGQQELIAAIRQELGEEANSIEERFNSPITIFINIRPGNEFTTNYAEVGSSKVHIFGISGLTSIYHELIHVLFGDCQSPWASEANAMYWPTYVSLDYYNKDSMSRFYGTLGDSAIEDYERVIREAGIKERVGLEAEYEIVKKWNEIYEKDKTHPNSYEEFDYKLFTESVGAACLLMHKNITRLKDVNILNTSVSQEIIKSQDISKEPNALNYYEAYVLMLYLLEEYGMDSFYNYYNNENKYIDAFGASYEDMYESFVKWLDDKYNYL